MIGGKLLGQGTYGCIFSPPLACEQGRKGRGKRLGKVGDGEDLMHEVVYGHVLKQIPRWDDYFLLPDTGSFCTTKVTQREKDIQKCKVLEKYRLGDAMQFTMSYGGKDVYETLLSANITPAKFDIIAFATHLLEAGALMTLNGFVHYDIHSGNVLLDSKYVPKLIDFGESFHMSDIDAEFVKGHWKVFDASFGPEPPEITVATGVRKGAPFQEVFDEVLQEKDTLSRAEALLGMSRRAQGASFQQFWETSRAARDGDWVALWKAYWPMFDSWAIGTLLLTVVRRILMTGGSIPSERATVLQDVVRGMVQMNPRERIDCVEALSMLDPMSDVLQGKNAMRWLEKRRQERVVARGKN
jgi:serine/threonine protein kinase